MGLAVGLVSCITVIDHLPFEACAESIPIEHPHLSSGSTIPAHPLPQEGRLHARTLPALPESAGNHCG
jgi:hypothetical protein